MALSKVNFNSMNVTPSASKAVKFNSSNNGLETGDIGGSLVLLSTQTASSSANISFTSGIDSTYKEYQVHFIDVHPATDNAEFTVNFRDGGSDFDATKTTTYFRSFQNEGGSDTGVAYNTSQDLAQGTGAAVLAEDIGNGNDESVSGVFHLFDPSSTTFVKHFISRAQSYNGSNYSVDCYVGGYANVTAAVDGVQFAFSSGNIDAGTFKLYGVS